jgi:hypothetical protein
MLEPRFYIKAGGVPTKKDLAMLMLEAASKKPEVKDDRLPASGNEIPRVLLYRTRMPAER